MRRLRWSIAGGVAAILVAAAAACADGSGSGAATPAVSVQPTAASPKVTPRPSPLRTDTESRRPAPAGSVTVTLSAPRYAAGDPVKVSVSNGSRDAIYTEDFQTACTIVTLQKSAGGSWTDITGCSMGRPTRTLTIEPGTAKEAVLDPHSFHLAEGAGRLGFGAGTYRIRFGYRKAAEPMGAQPLIVYSATFAVG